MENVVFCEAKPQQVQTAWRVGLSLGLAVYAVLAGLGLLLTRRHVPLFLSYRLYARIARLVPGLALVGTVAFLSDAHRQRHSLVTCESWGGVQWVAFLVNLCFLVRLFLHWAVTFMPQLMATVVDVWLFVQGCVALHHGFNMYAFTFLALVRFFHSECLTVLSRLSKMARSVLGLVLVILLVAGLLQVAEENESLYGAHPTAEGTLQPIRSFWVYVYWAVVTASTVGYGEITPSTNAAKGVLVVIVVVGILWFIKVSEHLGVWVSQYFSEARYPPPLSSHPRIVVLGESDPTNLARLLQTVKLHHINNLEVIVLLPSEVKSRYLGLRGSLHIKVVFCTSLKEDLTRLLPPMDNKRSSSARQHDAVVIFGDHEAEDPEAEDVRVLQLLVKAREFVPQRRFIVQVLLGRSRRAVQQTPCWSERDEVVCLEELSIDMLAQAAACSAAAPIISTLITAPANKGGGREKPPRVHKIRLQEPSEPVSEAKDFIQAVLSLYDEKGDLLLGWFSPETQDFDLLSNKLPPDAQWVVTSADTKSPAMPRRPSPNTKGPLMPQRSSANTKSTVMSQRYFANITSPVMPQRSSANTASPAMLMRSAPNSVADDCYGDPEEVSVAVQGVNPGRAALEAALHEFPWVRLLPEEEWLSASTVVVTTAGMGLSYVIEAHYLRTRLMREVAEASVSEGIRFVADVPHGQGQRAWDHRTTRDVVNKSMVVSAMATAIVDRHLYAIWRALAAKRNLLGVRVIKDCTYGEAFHALLREQRLLPLGVEVVHEDNFCITNPPASLPLTIGDLLLCFLIPPVGDAPSSPPVVLSQGISHSLPTFM